MSDTRIEKDCLGEMEVPAGAYYGAQTERARRNFPISGLPLARRFIARDGADQEGGGGGERGAGLAADEMRRRPSSRRRRRWSTGKLDDQFVVDIFQTGSRHLDQHERQRGDRQPRQRDRSAASAAAKTPVHPNDHVNMGQSSNDVIPTAIHVAAVDGDRARR